MKVKKAYVWVGAAVLFTPVAYSALVPSGPAEAWTGEQILIQSNTIINNIGAFTTAYTTQMNYNHQQVMSALKIVTKQEAMSEHQTSDTARKTAQQQANAHLAQVKTKDVIKANLDFNGVTGQGHQTSAVMLNNATVERKFEEINNKAGALVESLDNAPGKLANSITSALEKRIEVHNANFCTQAEADAGLCTLGKLPGADTNSLSLSTPAKPGSIEEKAQVAYIQNVLGTPDPTLPKSAGSTESGQEFLYQKIRKDALLAFPAYSLAAIKESNTIDSETNKTPNQLLTERVNAYFGGPEALEWAKTLSRQQPRGLMVESLKVNGIQTWLKFQHLQQTQRINGNLATLLIAANQQNMDVVQNKYLETLSKEKTKAN